MALALCIVGYGTYARSVLEDIHDMTEDIALFYASRDLEKAKSYLDTFWGASYFGSYEEAAGDPRVEALYFLTPHDLHLQNTLLAARQRKHVLVEKPIARTISEGRQMVRAARDAGVKLMVAENYRFLPTVEECKRLMEQESIGDLRLIQIETYAETSGWRTSAATTGGGGFIDGGIHSVDTMVHLGGLPERVYAAVPPRVLEGGEGEDGMVVTAHLPGGAVGLINYSAATPISGRRHRTHLTGSRGQLSFEPFGSEVSLSTRHGERTIRLLESGRGVRGMVREFRSCIREGREPAMSGEDGLRDLAVVLAAYRSAEEGAEVAVSLP